MSNNRCQSSCPEPNSPEENSPGPNSPEQESPTFTLSNGNSFPKVETNGLHLECAPFGLENVFNYQHCGLHPIHLGDLLGENGRYRVIHKLGNGGFANIWFCRDLEAADLTKYVAVKVLIAGVSAEDCSEFRVNGFKASQGAHPDKATGRDYICLPLDQFTIQGPNGDHLCFVYSVLGPKVSLGLPYASEDPGQVLRNISLKVVEAIAFLHSLGICHGDLTASNILLRVFGLDGLTEEEVLDVLGEPIRNPVLQRSGGKHGKPTAPQYLVYPVDWEGVDARYLTDQPCIIDFGESFEASQPPEDIGTPGPYRSPELILDKAAGLGSDLWALGCTLFEIRTGRKLLTAWDDDDDEYLVGMIDVLGPMPEPWWSTTWKDRKRYYKDEEDAAKEPETSKQEPPEELGCRSTVHPCAANGARSVLDKLAPGIWYMDFENRDAKDHWDISQKEQEVFADLLHLFLAYKPSERTSAKASMNHEWFKF